MPLFAANWKMHKGPQETAEYMERFARLYQPHADRRVIFFPPAISVQALREAAGRRKDLEFGVQDVHQDAAGAHTGAISVQMAVSAGAGWAMAGHSERRREFGDDDWLVGRKTTRILEAGLRPILCVGETLEERERGELGTVLARQAESVVSSLDDEGRNSLTYAYEPVWAIGTGRNASPDDAAEAHAILRLVITRLAGENAGSAATILYGGSVQRDNIESLMAAQGVDGVLVGGASLDPEAFAVICDCPVA
jgi:triosephosphate isomerase